MSDLSPSTVLFDKLGNPINVSFDGTNYRLCVDTRPTSGVSAQQQAWGAAPVAQTVATTLTKGTSAALNVNGSTTSQILTFPAQSKLVTIYGLRLVFTFTTVTFNGANFGAAAIANGITIGATISGTTSTIYTIKTNEDFYLANGGGLLTTGGSGILLTTLVLFNQPLAVSSTDQLAVTINDNLTGANILYGRAIALGIRAA